jgi:hypothetical protein
MASATHATVNCEYLSLVILMTGSYGATLPKETPHRPRVGGRNDWKLRPKIIGTTTD